MKQRAFSDYLTKRQREQPPVFGFIQSKDGSLFKLMNKTKPNADAEDEMNDAKTGWAVCIIIFVREIKERRIIYFLVITQITV